MNLALLPDGTGGVDLVTVADPETFPGSVRVRTTHTLISAGTELGMLRRTEGEDGAALRASGFRLGYNACGVVEEVHPPVAGISPGDRVACYGGPYVEHASQLVVPHRLLQKLPAGTDEKAACFMGLGAIALHGLRCGRIELGECVVFSGAGVIGRLAAQLACLAGCRVLLVDLRRDRLEEFLAHADRKWPVSVLQPEQVADHLSHGGADAVFLAMGTDNPEPLLQAYEWVRPRGRVVVLGSLPLHVPRDAAFDREASLVVSRAAGPGRYDATFEREGVDYPVGHVRWTEERNCAEVLRLIGEGRLAVRHLVSRTVPAVDAVGAYRDLERGALAGTVLLEWGAV